MTEVGEDAALVKLALLCSFCVPVRKKRGRVRRFSSIVEAGDAERGESMNDMDTVRLGGGGRDETDVDNGYGQVALLDVE